MQEQDVIPAKPIPTTPSIGEEFITWAERYWALKLKYTQERPDDKIVEHSNYDAMKDVFIKKINSMIQERLGC